MLADTLHPARPRWTLRGTAARPQARGQSPPLVPLVSLTVTPTGGATPHVHGSPGCSNDSAPPPTAHPATIIWNCLSASLRHFIVPPRVAILRRVRLVATRDAFPSPETDDWWLPGTTMMPTSGLSHGPTPTWMTRTSLRRHLGPPCLGVVLFAFLSPHLSRASSRCSGSILWVLGPAL